MDQNIPYPAPLIRQTCLGTDLNWLWEHRRNPELLPYVISEFFMNDPSINGTELSRENSKELEIVKSQVQNLIRFSKLQRDRRL